MDIATDEQVLEWLKIRRRGAAAGELSQLDRIEVSVKGHIKKKEIKKQNDK